MTRIKALNHFLPLLLFFVSITAKAQLADVRHEVEFDILNQFTVMEDGAGDLQPGYYYNLFHKGYKKLQGNGFGNPMTAKKNLRWLAEEVFKKEPDKAEPSVPVSVAQAWDFTRGKINLNDWLARFYPKQMEVYNKVMSQTRERLLSL